MSTITLDPTDTNINKAVRTPTAPSTSPSINLSASAGDRDSRNYALAGVPSIASVTSIEVNVYLEVVSQALGENSYFGLAITVGGVEYEVPSGVLTSAGAYAWHTVTIPIADIVAAAGATPASGDWATLKVNVNANAEAAGFGTSEINLAEAYVVLDYTAAGGGGGGGSSTVGFFPFP